MVFDDREDAGRRLGEAVEALALDWQPGCLVLGAARGGVVVAAPVAAALGAELGVAIVRKIGAPQQPELAIGAVAESGPLLLNSDLVDRLRIDDARVASLVAVARDELARRAAVYRAGSEPPELSGRDVCLVDDGVATGATLVALCRWARSRGPRRLVVAVPVGARDTVKLLEREADQVVALETPGAFHAVGEWYRDFHQVEDEEMLDVLRGAAR
jgi:putative phosphoribosyl transferase